MEKGPGCEKWPEKPGFVEVKVLILISKGGFP
jgi:hypothetical protein